MIWERDKGKHNVCTRARTHTERERVANLYIYLIEPKTLYHKTTQFEIRVKTLCSSMLFQACSRLKESKGATDNSSTVKMYNMLHSLIL